MKRKPQPRTSPFRLTSSLFSSSLANVDACFGGYPSRLVFFQGTPTGTLPHQKTHPSRFDRWNWTVNPSLEIFSRTASRWYVVQIPQGRSGLSGLKQFVCWPDGYRDVIQGPSPEIRLLQPHCTLRGCECLLPSIDHREASIGSVFLPVEGGSLELTGNRVTGSTSLKHPSPQGPSYALNARFVRGLSKHIQVKASESP